MRQEARIMEAAITPTELSQRLAAFPPPTLVDVRRQPAFDQDANLIPAALRRLPDAVDAWAPALEPWRPVVVYCVRGHEVSQNAAAALRVRGFDARYLEGGLERWRAEGHKTRPFAAATRWVTRERPKIDRIACPWLVRRFIDPTAEFFYVPNAEVRTFAAAQGATAYDIPDVDYSHVGPECSFDAFIHKHGLRPSRARRAREDRSRRRHLDARSFCAGARASRGIARLVGDVRRRPRDAEVGNAGLRFALHVVPRRPDGDARLVSGEARVHGAV
jgi:rhodanese-related sulfurtransferase